MPYFIKEHIGIFFPFNQCFRFYICDFQKFPCIIQFLNFNKVPDSFDCHKIWLSHLSV